MKNLSTATTATATATATATTIEKKVSCIMKNSKTLASVDFTTDCPKRREGKACKYCYVENARKINFNAKLIFNHIEYKGDVLKMSNKTVQAHNSNGGIRLFSFGDYMVENDKDIHAFLIDARLMRLKVKVITKQVAFIDKFYYDYNDVFSVIHLSIDNINNGVEWGTAQNYRNNYEKVVIRSVVLKYEDFEVLEGLSDIITLNHGNNGFYNFSGHGKENKALKVELTNKAINKVCCQTSNCGTCLIKCGYKA
jgi:hypothetical protein